MGKSSSRINRCYRAATSFFFYKKFVICLVYKFFSLLRIRADISSRLFNITYIVSRRDVRRTCHIHQSENNNFHVIDR